ncbi:NTF2-related export protein [Bacillus rossius redtenbacheri]|uniref:NTF2-related export protein n=1 Tax=Bacillus rossius redtenbacheri TaxID=93214 RepID=UPI002FDC92AB
MAQISAELKARIDLACRTAEEFSNLYYKSLDSKRHLMSKYYLDKAVLVWCGNGACGKENIQKFFEELPSTEHTLISMDSQPVSEAAVGAQQTVLIESAGHVKIGEEVSTPFQQSFLITAEQDKWKIVSDCFRLQEPVCV